MSDDLVQRIIADGEPFHKGCDEVRAHARELEHDLKHVGTEIAGALGLGFGIEKSVELVKEGVTATFEAIEGQIEKIVELSHLSERSGIDLNSIRALQLEAKHAGLEVDTLTRSITKMQVGLGEAVGGGSKRAIFEQLGLDPDELARENPAEAFAEIGDAIARLDNPISRVHVAFELFGKTGAESLNVIMQGSKGLHDALEKVGVVSDADVESMRTAHEATIDLEMASGKLARTLAGPAAEAITKFSYVAEMGIKAAAIELEGMIVGAKTLFNIFGGKGNVFGEEPHKAVEHGPTGDMIEAMARQKEDQAKALKDASSEFEKDQHAAQSIIEKFDPAAKAHREQGDVLDLYFKGHLNDDEMFDALDDVAKHLQKSLDDMDPLKKLKEEAKHLLEGADPDRKLQDAVEKANKLFGAGAVTQTEKDTLESKAYEDFEKAKLAEMGPLGEERREHIRGPEITEYGTGAYSDFFRNQHPDTDQEAAKQTELQRRLLDIQQQALAVLQRPPVQQTTPVKISP